MQLIGVHHESLIEFITKMHDDELKAELGDSNLYHPISDLQKMSFIGFIRKFDK